MMYLVELARNFVRGFGSVVDLSGRSLAARHMSTDELFEQLFESTAPVREATAGDEDRLPYVHEPAHFDIDEVADLHRFAISQIAQVSEAVESALTKIPEQQRDEVLPALMEVRERAISAILTETQALARSISTAHELNREIEMARLNEMLRSGRVQ